MIDCQFMEKQGRIFDRDHKVKSFPEEKCPNYGRVFASNCTNRDAINIKEVQPYGFSTSRNFAEKDYASGSFSNENESSAVVVDQDSKGSDISKRSSNGVASKEDIYSKSDISSDTGPHVNMESGVNAGTVKAELLNAGDFCKPFIQGRKHVTESSCSNSTVIVPVCSSNDSYQEISTEAKSSDHHTGGSSKSFTTDFGCTIDEPLASREVSGTSSHITQNAVYNIRPWENVKVSETIRSQNPFAFEEENSSRSHLKGRIVDGLSQVKKEVSDQMGHSLGTLKKGAKMAKQAISIHNRAPDSGSFRRGRNPPAINDTNVHFMSSQKLSCLTEVSIKNTNFSAVEGRSVELDPALIYQLDCKPCGKESSESEVGFAEDIATKALTSGTHGFDLNEDIHSNHFDCHKQLDSEIGLSCGVIRAVAKCGVPPHFPVTALKFEGAQGWKGSASTSAFRPTLSKSSDQKVPVSEKVHCPKYSKGFTGIDLNVAPEDDDAVHKLHVGLEFQDEPLKVNLSQSERLSIDLNCLDDTMDECPRTSFPVTSTKNHVVNFNLNKDRSSNVNNDVHQQWRNSQHMDKKALVSSTNSFSESSRNSDLSFMRPLYLTDLSRVPYFGHTQVRPILVAAPNMLQPVEQMQKVIPLQPIMQTFPSHSHHSGGQFFVGPSDSLSSSIQHFGAVPYARDPRVHTFFPQIMNQSTLSSFPRTPHLMQVVHVQGPTEVTSSDVVNEENFAVNGNTRLDTRQFLSPAKRSTEEEHVNPFHLATSGGNQPMKRREPDGGWTSCQLGTRQFSSWN